MCRELDGLLDIFSSFASPQSVSREFFSFLSDTGVQFLDKTHTHTHTQTSWVAGEHTVVQEGLTSVCVI